jgi:hypothetical protein
MPSLADLKATAKPRLRPCSSQTFLDHQAETAPRIGIGEPFVDDGAAGAHLVRIGRGDQHLLGREVAVQGGRGDPGAPGDLPIGTFGPGRRDWRSRFCRCLVA